MTVGVIVVNFFTEELLVPLVQRVATFPMVCRVVVFDNGSASPLSFADPRVRVISAGRNLGFAAAVNRAFAHLSTDYVLLLNPDLDLDARAVARMIEAAEGHGCPIVGPRFYWDDARLFRLPPATGGLRWLDLGAGRPDTLEGRLRGLFWAAHHDRFWAAHVPFAEPFLSGACLLLAADWLRARERVFDERFFMFYEDTDLCLEAQREGFMPICVPRAEVVHYWDQSPEPERPKVQLMREAHRAYMDKHYPSGRLEPLGEVLSPVAASAPLDLGTLSEPPVLSLERCPAGSCLEIAVEPGFVPFAQALVGPRGLIASPGTSVRLGPVRRLLACAAAGSVRSFRLPPALWRRLRRGQYYARLRNPLAGQSERSWKWVRAG